MDAKTKERIIELVKLSNAGNHYDSLRELSQYTLDEIYDAISEFPSMMGNFYEIVLKIHYYLRLHDHAGQLVNIDRGGRKAPTKLLSFSDLIGGGSGGGSVDITHLEFDNRAVIGITSKYKKADTLSLADLEFLAVCSSIDNNFPQIKKRYYGVLVRDRSQIEHLFKTGELKENHVIYDFNDARHWWYEINIFLLNNQNKSIGDIEQDIQSHQSIYITLRDEQFEGVRRAKRHFLAGNRDFLLNAKMRYGKIVASYEIAKRINAKTVLVATFFPSVIPQWISDCYDFANFRNIRTINVLETKDIDISPRTDDEITVVLTSYQDYTDAHKKAKWSHLINHEWDMVVSDEFHWGVESERTLQFLDTIKYKHHLALSGTPIKALLRGTFTPENTYTWSYIDEQQKKRQGLPEYKWLPTMHMHTIEIPMSVQQNLNMYSDDEGFTLNKLLSTNKGEFKYEDTVIRFLDMFGGESGFKKQLSPYSYGTTKTNGLRHTVWYMPDVKSCDALEKLLNTHPFFKKFKTISVNSKRYSAKDVLDVVRNVTNTAEHEGYYGSITLAYKQLNTGSSVPKWSGVFMINGDKSLESYMQTIFRAQTPNKDDNKHECHVFDFNPSRCLQILYEFSSVNATSTQSQEEYLREWLEFVPLMAHDDNEINRVDVERFLKEFSVVGNHSRTFGHEHSINALALDTGLSAAISHIIPDSKKINFGELTDNVINGGKNYKPVDRQKKIVNTDTIKKDKERLKSIAQTIPWLLLFTDNKYNTVSESLDSLSGDMLDAYEERAGVKINAIHALLSVGALDADYLNRQVISFNHAIHQNRQHVIDTMLIDSNNEHNLREHGDITTHPELIQKMFVKLPPNVWTNPDMKWLDMSCRSGTFLHIIFERLMNGLKDIFPDKEKRAKHILTKMLYGVDNRKSNITFTRIRLKYKNIIPTNLFVDDPVTHDYKNTFDIIVSNPPFQRGQYARTVRKAETILKDNGFMEFILPPNWMIVSKNSLVDLVNKYHLKHVEVNTINKYFPGRCGYTWLCINKNVSKPVETTFMSIFNNIQYHGRGNLDLGIGFIPKLISSDSLSILSKIKNHPNQRLDVVRVNGYNLKKTNKKTSDSRTDEFCYPYAHTSADNWKIRCWGNEPHPHQFDRKVIISDVGFSKPVYDHGTFGFTDHSFAILVDSPQEGQRLVDLLNSPVYVFVQMIANTNFGRMNHPEFYRFLPKLDLSKEWDNKSLYCEFGFNPKEIRLIESMMI